VAEHIAIEHEVANDGNARIRESFWERLKARLVQLDHRLFVNSTKRATASAGRKVLYSEHLLVDTHDGKLQKGQKLLPHLVIKLRKPGIKGISHGFEAHMGKYFLSSGVTCCLLKTKGVD
jgi:hypothetical protein